MARGPEIAVFATHIAPALGYGGVSVMAAALTKAWAVHARRIRLCACNASLGSALRPGDVQLGSNVEVRLYRAYWFRRWGFGFGAIPKIFTLCLRSPVAYIHGIATFPSTLAALACSALRRPFVVAPRGGLMPEHVAFIRRHKPHKWCYYKLLTLPTLKRAAAIHCTSDTEAAGVTALLGETAPVHVIPNGVDCKGFTAQPGPPLGRLVSCYLGHIQREKGINAFIRVWLRCRGPGDSLIVAGRGTDEAYFREFQHLVEVAEGAICYRGYVEHAAVRAILAESHFLVLPSGLEQAGGMRENFGNVVAEALAAGRPALVTRGLAWDKLETVGAGFVFDRTPASVAQTLARVAALSPEAWQALSLAARRYAERELDGEALAERVWHVVSAKLSDPDPQTVGAHHA
ncbi:MAG: glycosyltransferase family 4 protein [Gammaproteobacteria bacterium]